MHIGLLVLRKWSPLPLRSLRPAALVQSDLNGAKLHIQNAYPYSTKWPPLAQFQGIWIMPQTGVSFRTRKLSERREPLGKEIGYLIAGRKVEGCGL